MISLIVCTYKRATSLKILLQSIVLQTTIPTEILIIDGSEDNETNEMLKVEKFNLPIKYWQIDGLHRGLTKQRNFGVANVSPGTEIVCFLDDDLILDKYFFTALFLPFVSDSMLIGSSGYITNENRWVKYIPQLHYSKRWVQIDGYALLLSTRHYIRKILGLYTNVAPGYIPAFGHGYDSLPPSGKLYDVEHIMGGITAYRYSIFKKIKFSEYFVGYGLYEDFDFSVRAYKFGKLQVNTNAKLEHHHHPSGRPDMFKYGLMVIRNGWYVWRLKYKDPGFFNKIKWYEISVLQCLFLMASFKKKSVRKEFCGRMYGIFSVIFNPPVILE